MNGLTNVLRTVGVLDGQPVTRRNLGLQDAVIFDATDASDYALAPRDGTV